jgi:hypothetical protein
MVLMATAPVSSKPSTGEAAYNSLAMELQTKGMVSTSLSRPAPCCRSLLIHQQSRISHRSCIFRARTRLQASQIKSAEDLLSLTRLLRELWVIGPLRKPGEGEQETQRVIDENVRDVIDMMNKLRQAAREEMVRELGPHGSYTSGSVAVTSQGVSQVASQGISQTTSQEATQDAGAGSGQTSQTNVTSR